MLLSIVIPAHNEQGSIASTVDAIAKRLGAADIAFEIVVVDDHSSDGTMAAIAHAAQSCPAVRGVPNLRERGFGNAIQTGFEAFRGDAACVVMADASDDPGDIVAYWRAIERGYDCAFGSRFMRKATVLEYPLPKLLLNRFANAFVALLFGMRYNDITNAFKCYRREVIDGVRPVLSHHFNITVELPLKAIVRGYSWTVVPTNWYNRKHGVSKFNIKEMGSRYLFIVLYVLIERWLSRGDYQRPPRLPESPKADLPAPRSEAAAP